MTHSTTGFSPFYALHGYHPYDGYNPRKQTNVPAASDFAKHQQAVHKEVQAAIKDAQQRMKTFYDRNKGTSITYNKGDMVWVDAAHIRSTRPSSKLDYRRFGPFKIKVLYFSN